MVQRLVERCSKLKDCLLSLEDNHIGDKKSKHLLFDENFKLAAVRRLNDAWGFLHAPYLIPASYVAPASS